MGTALILAWSITLSNFSTAPQVINLGPAPTQNNYQITMMVTRNMTRSNILAPASLATVSFGSNPENPTDILSSWPIGGSDEFTASTSVLSAGPGVSNSGSLTLAAGQDLYVQYQDENAVPGESATIDIFAYPIPATQSGS